MTKMAFLIFAILPIFNLACRGPVSSHSQRAEILLRSSNLCEDTNLACDEVRAQISLGLLDRHFLNQQSDEFKMLKQLKNNVILPSFETDQLILQIKIPSDKKTGRIEIFWTPQNKSDADPETTTRVKNLLNELVVSGFIIYAEVLGKDTASERVALLVTRYTATDQEEAYNYLKATDIPIPSNTIIGERHFRGSFQEMTFWPHALPKDYFSADYLESIKKTEVPAPIEIYYQEGKIKIPPGEPGSGIFNLKNEHLELLDLQKPFCALQLSVEKDQDFEKFTLEGVFTLWPEKRTLEVKLVEDDFHAVALSFRRSKNQFGVINKSGNGIQDTENIKSIKCVAPRVAGLNLTVGEVTEIFGEKILRFSYPRNNVIETYMDMKMGYTPQLSSGPRAAVETNGDAANR